MLVAALLGRLGRPIDRGHAPIKRTPVDVGDRDARRTQVGHISFLEEDDLVRVRQDRGDIRRQEALAIGESDDQRDVVPGTHEAIAFAPMHGDDGVGALDLAQGVAHGVGQVTRVGLLDQVRDRLRVGLRDERMATLPPARPGVRGSSR